MTRTRTEHNALHQRIEELLLTAVPPLFQKVRGPAIEALAHRCVGVWRYQDVTPANTVAALRDCLDALQRELASVEEEAQALTRAWNDASDDTARKAVLVQHLARTVSGRSERFRDLRALRRWMGFDALRERQEMRRKVLLTQEELALLSVRGLLRRPPHADAAGSAKLCLARALTTPRPQNQVAAVQAVAAALQADAHALGDDELRSVAELLEGPAASPWLRGAAFEALLHARPQWALELLKARLRGSHQSAPRDFLFRRAAIEAAARTCTPEQQHELLWEAARADTSEYVRMGVAEALMASGQGVDILSHLAGLTEGAPEKSAKVRASSLIALSAIVQRRSPVWAEAAAAFTTALSREEASLTLQVGCDQAALVADALTDAAADEHRAALLQAMVELKARPGLPGPVLEAAANAAQALERASRQDRRAWTAYLKDALARTPPGGRLKVPLSPPPAGLPPLPEDDAFVGAILAELSRDDFGVYADRRDAALVLRRGEKRERKTWRVLHELRRPAPNKRQGFIHTVGRSFGGALRAHPGHLDEITTTSVPGERVHIASEGGWGRHLPTVDDLLDLPLNGQDIRLFSSHGITTVSPPASLSQRIKNRVKVSAGYEKLASLRLSSLQGREPRERRQYVDEVEQRLGVAVTFTAYDKHACPPRVASLFGKSGKDGALHAFGLPEASIFAQALDVLVENNDYFLGTRGNGVTALAVFTAGLFTFFLADAWRKRETVRRARAQIPLCIGGWGTRGKSGTERLKAALFTGLGFDVFAKTTGSEAMFVHTAPTGVPSEFFIFRPYDKATIWEQRDMVDLAARLGTEVFLWECMALQPDFVDLLQNEWMHDDYATLTNAYPDHEDIQGPAGVNVAEVISRFMPEGKTVITTEDHFLPLFKDAAKRKGTSLLHSPWWEADLIPDELLDLFPYREHPRNMALVALLGEQLGVGRTQALGLMAEHVQPEIGVLKVFPRVRVRGRQLTFINGHSANERTGFLNNWNRTGLDQVDPIRTPERAVVTVINNRWDRVARSEVFARILVEDAPADRHVLIGTNLEGLTKYIRDALDSHLRRLEVVSAEDLAADGGQARARERLAAQMLRLKIPGADVATFIDRLQRYAFGANLDLTLSADLTTQVTSALASDGDVHVAAIRRELENTVGPQIAKALRRAPEADEGAIPETLDGAGPDDVVTHALYLLARMVVHARLLRRLPVGATPDLDRRIATFHQGFRTAYRELFMEQLVPVHDPRATGDQIIDACARSVGPGLDVSILGAQNIKGTGLDWVYRWMAVDKVHGALAALETGTDAERTRAIELLESFADSGITDAALAASRLPQLIRTARTPDEADRLRLLAQRYRAVHEVKVAALRDSRTGSRAERFVRGVEKVFDYLDSVRRKKLAQQLVDDLVHGRVSHARAAIETRRLYERQKGGWLWEGLSGAFGGRKRAGAQDALSQLPASSPQASFDKALQAPHDVTVRVPQARPAEPSAPAPRQEREGPIEPKDG